MLSSKLNSMAIGPLWVLKNRVDESCCSVCGKPWLQFSVDEPSILVVLANPMTNEAEQNLFANCLTAAGWLEKAECFSLHENCSANAKLEEHIAMLSPAKTVVFGKCATPINGAFVVSHSPAEMMATPALKAQVWADLCVANSSAQ